MKRTASVLTLVLAMVMLMSQFAFASGLEVTDFSPKDGKTGMNIANMAVKVSFSEEMCDEAAVAANADKFTITDSEGNAITFEPVASDKYPDEIWLIFSEDLTSNTEYNVTALPGIVSSSGTTTAETYTSTFKTRNTSIDSLISTGLMVAMMVFMFSATKNAAKKAEETSAAPVKEEYEEMNPYKLAKEKGISVDEAKKIINEKREKQAKTAAKRSAAQKSKDEAMAAEVAAQQAKLEAEYEAARRANNYRVHKSGSVVDRGLACPKSVIKANKKKRAAEKAAAKKAAKKK